MANWTRGGFRRLLVLVDGTAESYQAAYAALHVAGRTGATLVAGAIDLMPGREVAARQLRRLGTSARAAGVQLQSSVLPALSAEAVRPQVNQVDGVFVARTSPQDPGALRDLFEHLPGPLWIVPAQRSIRNALLVYDQTPGAEAALALALALAHRWSLELQLLWAAPGPVGAAPSLGRAWQVLPQPSTPSILQEINRCQADLVCLGRPGTRAAPAWPICEQAGCLVVACAALNSL